ncbi:hypothetical protein [Bacillus paramycoides]|uniref:hypothetical protein n=1 Tax=Bacillus paramycoides TaxID=2026194 RepID=UPI002E21992C|nr:hypothetical protein [Bacillus paramycoides]
MERRLNIRQCANKGEDINATLNRLATLAKKEMELNSLHESKLPNIMVFTPTLLKVLLDVTKKRYYQTECI